jgi:hypothetical protein
VKDVTSAFFCWLSCFPEKLQLADPKARVADASDITGSNQRLTPFWSSLRAKFSVSRDCTFALSTLSSSEAECRKKNSTSGYYMLKLVHRRVVTVSFGAVKKTQSSNIQNRVIFCMVTAVLLTNKEMSFYSSTCGRPVWNSLIAGR